ncbi:MAG: N-acetylmuramoyl-L-alanine amidase, partial [Verrucomicrobia bacterium]|nr:N-acetylmuramoyl-L-alanine amidase [Verrucomicrobiota bacterium]
MLIRAACAMLFVLICSPPSLLAQTELIANGGFESGVSGWTPSGSIGSPVSSLYGFARSGSYYLWLGGTLNLSEITYQSVTIPASVTSATLSFYYNINSLEGNSAAYDKFSVTVRNASGVLLATVGEWSNMNQDPSGGNPYYHQKTFDLLPFAGSTILIYFSSVNDSTLVTNFRVDDVSVRVTTAQCLYAISPVSATVVAGGGSQSFGVTAGGGCSWTASTSQSWIHTTSSGTGSGTVAYTVDANPATATRAGTIAVGGQQFSISQAGVSSQTDFPSAVWIPAGSGHFTSSARGSADVTSIVIHTTEDSYYGATISWFQNTSDPTANTSSHYLVQRDGSVVQFVREKDIAHHAGVWLWNQHSVGIEVERLANATETITSFQYASVKSLVESIRTRFSVPLLLPASTPLSSPTLVVDGIVGHGKAVYYGTDPVNWSWTLFQQLLNPSCTYSVNPPSTTLPASGGSGNIGVTTVGGCAWTAAASQTWIHTTSSGIGSGTVAYTVDANSTTSARAGSITVGGQTFTISQTGATCTYALSSSGTSLPASGGSGNIVVNTAGGCAWTAAASQTWIHTTSSGTGSGTVAYTVDA